MKTLDKNALLFYNRLTNGTGATLSDAAVEFMSNIDSGAIKKALVVNDVSGGSYGALALKYGCTRYQVRHWLKTKATTN